MEKIPHNEIELLALKHFVIHNNPSVYPTLNSLLDGGYSKFHKVSPKNFCEDSSIFNFERFKYLTISINFHLHDFQ